MKEIEGYLIDLSTIKRYIHSSYTFGVKKETLVSWVDRMNDWLNHLSNLYINIFDTILARDCLKILVYQKNDVDLTKFLFIDSLLCIK